MVYNEEVNLDGPLKGHYPNPVQIIRKRFMRPRPRPRPLATISNGPVPMCRTNGFIYLGTWWSALHLPRLYPFTLQWLYRLGYGSQSSPSLATLWSEQQVPLWNPQYDTFLWQKVDCMYMCISHLQHSLSFPHRHLT